MTAPLDIAALRAATPGAATAHHLNAAGASLPTRSTIDAIAEHLELEARCGGYEAAAAAAGRIEAVYDDAAALIGAERDEIALVESATVGWRRVVDALGLGAGDRVVVSRSGYVSFALHLLALERQRGVRVEVLSAEEHGLERALAAPASLLLLTHVPTSAGTVEPVAVAGALARAAGVPYVLDATQSVGQLPVDVEVIGCDALVTTGRKFLRGPRGTGIVYVRRALLERLTPIPDVRAAEWTGEREWSLAAGARRLETWEAAVALRLGLGAALAETRRLGVEAIAERLVALARGLRVALAGIPGVELGEPVASASAIVTFHVRGVASAKAATLLAERGVSVVAVPPAHGWWDLGARGLPAVVRASPHVYTDDDDLAALVDGVAAIAGAPTKERAA